MKLHSEQHNIERRGIATESSFSIKMSAKAFQTLSSTLYSNKQHAVIRELTCNAWDAHVDAGNTSKAVTIHLPTMLEPNFVITDYGTGLSNDDIVGMYTTFFHSTKEDTNSAIGAFGLGSKSPFSITDSFTVATRFAGHETTFLLFLDANRIPAVTKISSTTTVEHAGLTVTVPVPDSMRPAFSTEARGFFEYFTGKVDFDGLEVPVGFDSKVIHKVSRTNFLETGFHNYAYVKHNFVRQGGVCYEIDRDFLTAKNREIFTGAKCSTLTDFPIGALDVAPSRESLSYDDQTVEALNDYFDKLREAITWEIGFQVTTCLADGDVGKLYNLRAEHKKFASSLFDENFYMYETEVTGVEFVSDADKDEVSRETKFVAVKKMVSATVVYFPTYRKTIVAAVAQNTKRAGQLVTATMGISGTVSGRTRAVERINTSSLLKSKILLFKDINTRVMDRLEAASGNALGISYVMFAPIKNATHGLTPEEMFQQVSKHFGKMGFTVKQLSDFNVPEYSRALLSDKTGYRIVDTVLRKGVRTITTRVARRDGLKLERALLVNSDVTVTQFDTMRKITDKPLVILDTHSKIDPDAVAPGTAEDYLKREIVDRKLTTPSIMNRIAISVAINANSATLSIVARSLHTGILPRGTFEYEAARLLSSHRLRSNRMGHFYYSTYTFVRKLVCFGKSDIPEVQALIDSFTAYSAAIKKLVARLEKSSAYRIITGGRYFATNETDLLSFIVGASDLTTTPYRKPPRQDERFILAGPVDRSTK